MLHDYLYLQGFFLTEGQTSESWVPYKFSNLSEIENYEESLFGFFS